MPDERTPRAPTQESPSEVEADSLERIWADVLGPRPETDEARLIRTLGAPHPGTLTLASSTGRIIVQIDPNGKVTLGEGVTADEAAESFWTSMALKRRGMEERLLHLSVCEQMLQRVARADMAYEQAALRARAEDATEEIKFREELQRRNLEAIVHQVIEFARGLVLRQDAPQGNQPPPST